jgi:hypothetical protein
MVPASRASCLTFGLLSCGTEWDAKGDRRLQETRRGLLATLGPPNQQNRLERPLGPIPWMFWYKLVKGYWIDRAGPFPPVPPIARMAWACRVPWRDT